MGFFGEQTTNHIVFVTAVRYNDLDCVGFEAGPEIVQIPCPLFVSDELGVGVLLGTDVVVNDTSVSATTSKTSTNTSTAITTAIGC